MVYRERERERERERQREGGGKRIVWAFASHLELVLFKTACAQDPLSLMCQSTGRVLQEGASRVACSNGLFSEDVF